MAISSFQYEMIGARPYIPDGPLGGGVIPPFKPGTVASGDFEAEFVYLLMNVSVVTTFQQGDFFQWDNNYVASPVAQILATVGVPIGTNVGTLFLGMTQTASLPFGGGDFHGPTFTFAVGTYGCWFQRAGTSLGHVNAVTTQGTQAVSGPTATLCTFATGATHSQALVGLAPCNQKWTFSATTLTGSNQLSAATFGAVEPFSIVPGLTLSGTGIPNGTVVTDVTNVGTGYVVVMSKAATASAAITVTAAPGVTYGGTTSGSPILTGILGISGIYPGQAISGTGVPASTTILAIGGFQAPYQIMLSKNATATAAAPTIAFTTSSGAPIATNLPNYIEVFMRWPYFSGVAA